MTVPANLLMVQDAGGEHARKPEREASRTLPLDGVLAADAFEEVHRWWQDALQDLDHLRDVLLASLGDAANHGEEARIRYGLWLGEQACSHVEALLDLFPQEADAFKRRQLALLACTPEQEHRRSRVRDE